MADMRKKSFGKEFVRGMLVCIAVGAGVGVLSAILGGPTIDRLFERTTLTGLDLFTTLVLVMWIVICALSIVFFLLARFSKVLGEKSGILQAIGSGKRGMAVLVPLVLFYLGNAGLLILLLIAKLSGFDPKNGVSLVAFASLFGAMMVYGGYRCWVLLDELLRGIWIDANAITSGFLLVFAMILGFANLVGVGPKLTLFHAIGIYHALYLVVNIWLTAVRAPAMLTNPLAEEA
jgi:hypothetical protein